MLSLIQYLKNLWQKYDNEIIAASLIISMIIAASILQNKWGDKPITNIHEIPQTQTVYIKDEKYAKTLEQTISVKDRMIDSMARAIHVKSKQIKTVDRVVVKVDTLIKEKIVYKKYTDSSLFSYQDRYVSLFAVGKDTGSHFDFRLTPDTLDITKVSHTPLFGKSYTNGYIHHSNPYFNSPAAASFLVEQPRVLFDIGVSGGYDLINHKPYLGIGIQPNFARIRIYKRRQ